MWTNKEECVISWINVCENINVCTNIVKSVIV